ncbi:hypothetical protein NKG94_36765 [Micromonospora sp. M12]
MPALLRTWTGAFPDLRVDPMGAVRTAGGAAVELRLTGTHTGTLHSPYGTVAPTGRLVSWEVADVVRARRAGSPPGVPTSTGASSSTRSAFSWQDFPVRRTTTR